jgi:DNA-binding HxlR family transcriptional regulator
MVKAQFCSIIKPIELISDSWTLLIIKSLLTGTKRFNEIKNDVEDINNRTLSARLKFLVEKGVLIRRVSQSTTPPSVKYTLTPLGKGIEPILNEIENFGNKYLCE